MYLIAAMFIYPRLAISSCYSLKHALDDIDVIARYRIALKEYMLSELRLISCQSSFWSNSQI